MNALCVHISIFKQKHNSQLRSNVFCLSSKQTPADRLLGEVIYSHYCRQALRADGKLRFMLGIYLSNAKAKKNREKRRTRLNVKAAWNTLFNNQYIQLERVPSCWLFSPDNDRHNYLCSNNDIRCTVSTITAAVVFKDLLYTIQTLPYSHSNQSIDQSIN